ncbi:MAG: hypothetical protein K0S47_160 [Herbinix sp.]|jgi:uncharacterized SAM-binding protein YcdF (DUF218 family)|nr:hypothetical protein [Herbinix sp.]
MISRTINDISNFVFVEDDLEKADVIFIPGGSYPEASEQAARLWREGYASWIVPSGGVSIRTGKFGGVKARADLYNKQYITECDFMTDVLLINGVKKEAILGEENARLTKENAEFSRKLLDGLGITIKKGILCCKNFHARRALMFYQFAFPEVDFYVKPVPYYESGIQISKDNWYTTEVGTNKVFGELLRYSNQFVQDFEELRTGLPLIGNPGSNSFQRFE